MEGKMKKLAKKMSGVAVGVIFLIPLILLAYMGVVFWFTERELRESERVNETKN